MEFGAVARTYPVACSGVRQRNFDWHICADCEIDAGDHKEVYKELSQNLEVSVISGCVHYKPVVKFSQYSYTLIYTLF